MTADERDVVALFRELAGDDVDVEYTTDQEIADLWAAWSNVAMANWLITDGLNRDLVIGMVRGWAARQRHERWERGEG